MSDWSDHLQYKYKIQKNLRLTKYFAAPIVITFLIIIGLLANEFIQNIERDTKRNILSSLNSVVNANLDAVSMHIYNLQEFTERFQNESELRTLVNEQLKVHATSPSNIKGSEALKKIQQYFEKYDAFKGLGFFIIAPDNTSIASRRLVNIGTKNLIAIQKPALLKKVWEGETVVVPPILSDIPLKDHNHHLVDNPPTMFLVTPIFEQGRIIAALSFRINTIRDFSQFTENTRFQPYSDSYIFDKRGYLLNNTRHHDQIHSAASRQTSEPLSLHDPQATTLTLMAGLATRGTNGNNMEGYSNIIGTSVFGSWVWSDKLEIGFAAETEKEKALETYYMSRRWVIALYIFTVIVTLGSLLSLVISSNRTFNILHTFNNELEKNIEDKTKDLSKANLSLQKAKESAELANTAKSTFLSNMSHELRTPLNAVLGFTQIIKTDENTPNDQFEIIEEIESAGKILLKLIDEILDLSKIELGNLPLNTEIVNAIETLESSISMIKPLADNKNITISASLPETAIVKADSLRLHQIFVNLLSNAIKYNNENGKVNIDASIDNNKLDIKFSDNGFGIDAKQLSSIYEPFSRMHPDHTDIEGTGIGLAITRQLVEQQNGVISVKSELGKGSTFTITFPCFQEDKLNSPTDNLIAFSDYKKNKPDNKLNKTILLVEDNETNIKLCSRMLKPLEYVNLIVMKTAEDGLDYLHDNPVDLVLMDINLPGMTGFQALKEIRKSNNIKNTPVIAVTANAMKEDVEQGLNAGFEDYISKPIDMNSFLSSIEFFLNSKNKE